MTIDHWRLRTTLGLHTAGPVSGPHSKRVLSISLITPVFPSARQRNAVRFTRRTNGRANACRRRLPAESSRWLVTTDPDRSQDPCYFRRRIFGLCLWRCLCQSRRCVVLVAQNCRPVSRRRPGRRTAGLGLPAWLMEILSDACPTCVIHIKRAVRWLH